MIAKEDRARGEQLWQEGLDRDKRRQKEHLESHPIAGCIGGLMFLMLVGGIIAFYVYMAKLTIAGM